MISSLLDRLLTLQRQQITPDASGGSSRSFTTLQSNLPCAISPASASIAADYARRDMVVDSHVYTTADLDSLVAGGVKLGDRFTDGTAYYMVKAVLKSANSAVSNEVIYQVD